MSGPKSRSGPCSAPALRALPLPGAAPWMGSLSSGGGLSTAEDVPPSLHGLGWAWLHHLGAAASEGSLGTCCWPGRERNTTASWKNSDTRGHVELKGKDLSRSRYVTKSRRGGIPRNSKRTEEIKIKRLELGRTWKSKRKALVEKPGRLETSYRTKGRREQAQIQQRARFTRKL